MQRLCLRLDLLECRRLVGLLKQRLEALYIGDEEKLCAHNAIVVFITVCPDGQSLVAFLESMILVEAAVMCALSMRPFHA